MLHPSVFSFPDDILSKCKWIFIKLGMCIDVVEIWFGIANRQILSIFDRVFCLRHIRIFVLDDNFSEWIFMKLGMDIMRICFGIAHLQILSHFFSELSACNMSVFSFSDDNLSEDQ